MRGAIADNWYAGAFDELYPVVYAHRTVAAAAPELEFAAKCANLRGDDRLLDLCCGAGRHLVHALEITPHAFGLDYSPPLLKRALANTRGEAFLTRGDMRALPYACGFDCVFNFFTSFGYFARRDENVQVVSEIARVLRPAGRFFLDYLNPPHVRENLVPCSTREQDGFVVREERWIDDSMQRVNKRTTISRKGVVISGSAESVQLYPIPEFLGMLEAADLEIDSVFGGYSGEAHSDTSPRTIVCGTRR